MPGGDIFSGMNGPSAGHGKDEDRGKQLRRALRGQIRHPYITGQGLDSDPDQGLESDPEKGLDSDPEKGPDSDPEKGPADGAPVDDETPGLAAEPPPPPAKGDEGSEGGVETS